MWRGTCRCRSRTFRSWRGRRNFGTRRRSTPARWRRRRSRWTLQIPKTVRWQMRIQACMLKLKITIEWIDGLSLQFKLSVHNWLFKEGFQFQARAKSEINLQDFHEDLNFSQGQKSSIEDVRQFHFNQNRAHVKSFTRPSWRNLSLLDDWSITPHGYTSICYGNL